MYFLNKKKDKAAIRSDTPINIGCFPSVHKGIIQLRKPEYTFNNINNNASACIHVTCKKIMIVCIRGGSDTVNVGYPNGLSLQSSEYQYFYSIQTDPDYVFKLL